MFLDVLLFHSALTEHHLKYLLEDTFDVRNKWYFVGLCLNLPPSSLDAIMKDWNTTEERYTEVLKQWLRKGGATMKKLIDALASRTVEENTLVSRLRKKYANKVASQAGILCEYLPFVYN